MRKGLVYGMAGVLAAGDAVTSFARGVGQGVRHAGETAGQASEQNGEQAGGMQQETEAGKTAEATPSSRRKTTPKAESTRVAEGAGGKSA
jgi:hypothetical protein